MQRGTRVLAPTAAEKPTVEGSLIIEKIMQSSSELAARDAWRRFKSDGKSHGGPAEVLRNALVDAVSATSWLTTERCVTTRISEGKETPALRIVEGTVCVSEPPGFTWKDRQWEGQWSAGWGVAPG